MHMVKDISKQYAEGPTEAEIAERFAARRAESDREPSLLQEMRQHKIVTALIAAGVLAVSGSYVKEKLTDHPTAPYEVERGDNLTTVVEKHNPTASNDEVAGEVARIKREQTYGIDRITPDTELEVRTDIDK